ncbi:hypothetical protein H0485_04170 [Pseudogemmobacter sp. CC-YST710]|uniref:Ca-activated chloride channel family protein n=2 Tax=Pseudogemmobacter faecipullorum TaxID=2755041 RepID=A0ABS8CIL0_9RHOB|nr:hypothetical protein [Pseudogemmobacter faecipullorum]
MIRLVLAASGLVLIAIGGLASLAKLALVLGLPGLAATLLSDPAIRGVAAYQAGDFPAADDAFRTAGRGSTYNRGLSLAMTGDLALSRAYFDAVLFANPADSQARDNRNTVNALIPPVIGIGNEAGRIAAKAIAEAGGSPVEATMRLGRQLVMGGRSADAAWLAGLPDDAGDFLRLRLEAEHQRRLSLGLTAPEKGDPW